MKIGPDGSLPRITSSNKGLTSNLKIAKVPDDNGIGKSGFMYKLVFTGENEERELSEKSDEEAWSEEDIPNTNPSEKDKSIESTDLSCNQSMVESRSRKVTSERPFNNSNRNRRNHHRYNNHGKRNNANSSFNKPNNEKRNNFNKRSYGSSGNYGNYNKPLQNTPEPWVVPPMVHAAQNYQFPPFACTYIPAHINPLMQAPPNSAVDTPVVVQNQKTVGLLGDSPYTPPHNFSHRLDFQSNKQNEEFSSHPKKYQASNKNDAFLLHPSNYHPNNNSDEFGSPPLNYQASSSNDKFISHHPSNFEATKEIPSPTNHQSKQKNNFVRGQNYYDEEQYNKYPDNYSNRQRFQHYPKRFREQFNNKNHNRGNHNRRRPRNRQFDNNYSYQSSRTQKNDQRNANDHFDYRN